MSSRIRAMLDIKCEREQHTTDGGTTWTVEIVAWGRSLKWEWYGPTHFYHPETPDHYRGRFDQ